MNSVIELLKNRVSCPKLTSPGPKQDELEQMLACGLRAPDHARLKPWRFHVLQGVALNKLGEVFEQAASAGGEISEDKRVKCRNMPLRAPLMIVAVCEPTMNPKVPEVDQLLAVGAAVQNIQLAANSLGYGSIWRTGEMATSKVVKNAFNLSLEGKIVGFLYVGTPEKQPNHPGIQGEDLINYWE
jgi:nitroreductase